MAALDGEGDEITVTLKAPDLKQIGRLGGNELPPVGPVDLTMKISAIEDGHKLSALEAKIARSDLKGEISIAHQRKPIFIKAGVSSSLLDLTPFRKQDPDEKPTPEEEAGERIFFGHSAPLRAVANSRCRHRLSGGNTGKRRADAA